METLPAFIITMILLTLCNIRYHIFSLTLFIKVLGF